MRPFFPLKAHCFTAAFTLQTDVTGHFLQSNIKGPFLPHQQNLLQESVARKEIVGGGPEVDQTAAERSHSPLNSTLQCLPFQCSPGDEQRNVRRMSIQILRENIKTALICGPATMTKRIQAHITDPAP